MEASITPECKEALLVELNQLYWRRRCKKRELLSLIGKLSFACKVVPSGRIFLRRLIDLSTSVEKLHHHLPLTQEAKLDMKWWLDFLPQWPGKSLILESHWTSNTLTELFTDASGKDGWGAYWAGRWISDHWSTTQQGETTIAWKELYAITMAVNTWGNWWQRRKILIYCDNQTVVNVWEKGTCKSPEIMALVRMIYFCAAHNNFNVCVQHIPGVRNDIADALSCFQHHRFRRMAPKANPHPDVIPAWPQQAFIAASCNVDIMVSPINSAHISIRSKCLLTILLTFQHLAHTSFIFESPIFLCGQKPISIL